MDPLHLTRGRDTLSESAEQSNKDRQTHRGAVCAGDIRETCERAHAMNRSQYKDTLINDAYLNNVLICL